MFLECRDFAFAASDRIRSKMIALQRFYHFSPTSLLCTLTVLASSSRGWVEANSTPATIIDNDCPYKSPEFVCVKHYGSSMPAGSRRNVSLDILNPDQFVDTSIPDDTSFDTISKATFIIWDKAKAAAVLGQKPKYEDVFKVSPFVHEGPVYVT